MGDGQADLLAPGEGEALDRLAPRLDFLAGVGLLRKVNDLFGKESLHALAFP